jgi:tetratricopeptide (TPR) repeat protein
VWKHSSKTWGSQSDFWIYCLLLLATFSAYAPARHLGFVNYDDPEYVADNQHVRSGITAGGVVWAFTSREAANWFPLTRLSEMLDCQLFGLDSTAHHLVNVIFHGLAAVMLFAFLHRATGARWPSALVAFLFALHPLHVESVAWVSERKDVLSALFWFLSLWAWVNYASRKERGWYVTALVAFVLGLMAKPMIVTLPLVLVLLDLWPLRRRALSTEALAEKIPFFALSAAASIATYLFQRGSGAVVDLVSVPFGTRVENALVCYVVYVAKTLWPTSLAVFYPYPPDFPIWQVLLAVAALAGMTLVVLRCHRARPYLAAGWLWYLVTLLPVIGLVQVGSQQRADRYLYVPMVGLTIILAWGAADVVARWPQLKPVAIALAVLACATCGVLTSAQTEYWESSESLFRHALQVTTGNYLAHYNLGLALSSNPERLNDAVREFEAALRIRPDYADARNNLGVALWKTLGRSSEVLADYQTALRLAPNSAAAHNNLGNALSNLSDRLPEAIAEYEAALRLKPDYAEAHNNLGTALSNVSGRLPEAIAQYQSAIRLKPDYANAHYNLGNALAKLPDRLPEAIAEYRAALRIEPDSVEAHNNLAAALSRDPASLPEAITEYHAALRIKPDFAEAHFNLGNLLSALPGRLAEAIAEYQAALRIRPDYAEAHGNLGAALARTPERLPEAIAQFEAALKIRPDLVETQYNLGVALLNTPGLASDALSHFEAVMRLRPDPQLQQLVARLRARK